MEKEKHFLPLLIEFDSKLTGRESGMTLGIQTGSSVFLCMCECSTNWPRGAPQEQIYGQMTTLHLCCTGYKRRRNSSMWLRSGVVADRVL